MAVLVETIQALCCHFIILSNASPAPPRPPPPPIITRHAQLADYKRVVDLYKLRWVDFDIEGGAIKELPSVQRRHRVLKRLQVGSSGGARGRG
jgi:hypothetical protein